MKSKDKSFKPSYKLSIYSNNGNISGSVTFIIFELVVPMHTHMCTHLPALAHLCTCTRTCAATPVHLSTHIRMIFTSICGDVGEISAW